MREKIEEFLKFNDLKVEKILVDEKLDLIDNITNTLLVEEKRQSLQTVFKNYEQMVSNRHKDVLRNTVGMVKNPNFLNDNSMSLSNEDYQIDQSINFLKSFSNPNYDFVIELLSSYNGYDLFNLNTFDVDEYIIENQKGSSLWNNVLINQNVFEKQIKSLNGKDKGEFIKKIRDDDLTHLRKDYPELWDKFKKMMIVNYLIKHNLNYCKTNLDKYKNIPFENLSFEDIEEISNNYWKLLYWKDVLDRRSPFYYFVDKDIVLNPRSIMTFNLLKTYSTLYVNDSKEHWSSIIMYQQKIKDLPKEHPRNEYIKKHIDEIIKNSKYNHNTHLKANEELIKSQYEKVLYEAGILNNPSFININDNFVQVEEQITSYFKNLGFKVERITNSKDSIKLGEEMDICLARSYFDDVLTKNKASLFVIENIFPKELKGYTNNINKAAILVKKEEYKDDFKFTIPQFHGYNNNSNLNKYLLDNYKDDLLNLFNCKDDKILDSDINIQKD